MKTFQIGEHVRCWFFSTRSGVSYSPIPDTGDAVTITIYDPDGTAQELGGEGVEPVAMSESEEGKFYYDFASSGKAAGWWRTVCLGTDGSLITIGVGGFILE